MKKKLVYNFNKRHNRIYRILVYMLLKMYQLPESVGTGRRHWKNWETRKLRRKSGSRKHCNMLVRE